METGAGLRESDVGLGTSLKRINVRTMKMVRRLAAMMYCCLRVTLKAVIVCGRRSFCVIFLRDDSELNFVVIRGFFAMDFEEDFLVFLDFCLVAMLSLYMSCGLCV